MAGDMLDPNFVRDHLDLVRAGLRSRGIDPDADLAALAGFDTRRRAVIVEVEELKRQQNTSGEEVARAKKEGRDPSAVFAANRERGQQIKRLEADLEAIERLRTGLLLTIPNLPAARVPVGKSAADNLEVRRVGEPRAFDFEPQAHWDLGPALGIIDFERATKVSGARFAFLMGDGARLSRALINFMLSLHSTEHGYLEVEPPFMVNAEALTGTGNLPKFEADLFKIAGDWDLYLVPTAEVPLTNLHRGRDPRRPPAPAQATAPTPRASAARPGRTARTCAASSGSTSSTRWSWCKFAHPDRSHEELESLTHDAEQVLVRLGLPYRTVMLCTGDMGFASAKTYDIEVWLPSQRTYREISSCSNTEAFQARRANIKFRPEGKGKAEFVHTLNGSGLAVGRTLIAIVENYQQKDGSIVIPEALRPFMGGQERIVARA